MANATADEKKEKMKALQLTVDKLDKALQLTVPLP